MLINDMSHRGRRQLLRVAVAAVAFAALQPAAPAFAQIAVVITSPAEGATVADSTPTLSGTGEPTYLVDIYGPNGPSICQTTVTAAGTWSCTLTTPLANGPHMLLARQAAPGQEPMSVDDVVFMVNVAEEPALRPVVITSPPDGAVLADNTPTFTGTGEPGYVLDLYLSDTLVCRTTISAAGTWTCTINAALAAGPHRLVAVESSVETGDPVSVATVDVVVSSAPGAPLLPVTGVPVHVLVIGAVVLLVSGFGLRIVARRG